MCQRELEVNVKLGRKTLKNLTSWTFCSLGSLDTTSLFFDYVTLQGPSVIHNGARHWRFFSDDKRQCKDHQKYQSSSLPSEPPDRISSHSQRRLFTLTATRTLEHQTPLVGDSAHHSPRPITVSAVCYIKGQHGEKKETALGSSGIQFLGCQCNSTNLFPSAGRCDGTPTS